MKNETCDKCGTVFNPQTVDKCPSCELTQQKNTQTLRIGHFRRLVDQKEEENTRLRSTQLTLANSIKSLWEMIRLLENRKYQLEKYIEELENYLRKGSDIADDFTFIESEIMPINKNDEIR